MKRIYGLLLLVFISCETQPEDKIGEFQTHFEITEGKETATYLQVIDFYIQLAKEFPEINIQTLGAVSYTHLTLPTTPYV